MNNNSGALSFEAVINNSQFNAASNDMANKIRGLTSTAVTETKKIDSAFSNLAKVAGGYFAFTELASLPQKLIQVRGEFQNLEIAFNTMLGSKSKADALFKDVVNFAASTPFDLKGVATASKQLLAYGFASEDVISTLRRLGDISAGLSIPLGELSDLYGKTRTNGRLYGDDLNQFVGRGIPLIKLLSEQFGVAESQVRGLVEQGKVGFPEVEKAINKLTDSGGMFAGLMAEQSKSLTGLYANFEDAVDKAFNGIGKSQEGLLGETIKFATNVVDNYEPIIDVLKVIVAGYGAYRAALIATSALQAIPAAQLFVTEYLAMGKALGFATANQIAFNGAILANPYALAAAAIVGLVVAVALFRDTTTEAEKAQQRIANVNDKVTESLAGESSKIQTLVAQIKNENVSRDERNNKLKELISIHPKLLDGITLENIATEKGTKAINDYIEARKRQIEVEQLNAELTESIKRQLDSKNGKNELGFLSTLGNSFASAGQSSFTAGSGTNFAKLQADETKKLNADIVKSESELQKSILERVTALQTADAAASKSGKNTKEVVEKNLAYYDAEIKKLTDEQKAKSTNQAQFIQYQKEIDKLEKDKNKITGGRTKADKAADKEAEKSGPYGSTSYWDYISGKAKEVLANIPTDQTGRINAQKEVIAEIERKAEIARKITATKTFEDELEEKKKLYKSYQLWVDNLGQEAADQQFDGLITKGKSYAAYLNSQIGNLESVHPDSLTGQEQEKLVKLKVEYSDITNSETPLQKFQKRLDGIRSSASSLTDEIIQLQKVQSELSPTDMSPDTIAMRQSAKQQEIDAANERKKQFRDYVLAVAGSEQKRLEIEGQFKDKRVELEEQYGKEKGKAYMAALRQIEEDEKKAYKDQDILVGEKSKEFKEFVKIAKLSNEEISRDKLVKAREDFAKFTEGLDKQSDKYKGYQEDLIAIEENYKAKSLKRWQLIAGAVGQLSDVLQEMGGTIGEVGSALSGLGGQFDNISTAFNSIGKDKEGNQTISAQGYAAALQGVLQIVGSIISANKKRHEDEKAFALARITFENQYQLTLNQQLGQSYSEKDSIFNKDIEAKIKAGVDQYQDAQKKYQAAIDKLDEGRSKVRQKNVVDGKTTGQLVGAGAATGAIVGAIIGGGVLSGIAAPVGAAVGAVVGLIGGLFAKKKKDVFGGLLEQYPELILKGVDGWESLNVAMAKSLIATGQVDDKTKELLETTIAYGDELEKSKAQILEGLTELSGSLGDSIRNALVGAFRDGTDAAVAFGDAVGDVVADMASKLLFTTIFSQKFKDLEESMVASYGVGGDGTVVDDLGNFFAKGDVQQGVKDYTAGLELINQEMEKYGLKNVFGKTSGTSSMSPLQGEITGVTEKTAGVLEGNITALRITTADSNVQLRNILFGISNISQNSNYLPLLLDISNTLKDLKVADNFNRQYGGQ